MWPWVLGFFMLVVLVGAAVSWRDRGRRGSQGVAPRDHRDEGEAWAAQHAAEMQRGMGGGMGG